MAIWNTYPLAYVRRVSLRSTTMRRFAKADLIKPSELRHAGKCLIVMDSAPSASN